MTDLITKFSLRSDLHQSSMHAAVMADIGWQTASLSPGSNLFFRRLGPFSIAKLQRPKEIDSGVLRGLRRRHRSLLTYLEPGLTHSAGTTSLRGIPVEPFAHSRTSLLDLCLSKQGLLDSFNQSTRHNILHGLKDEVVKVRSIPLKKLKSTDLTDFFTLHHSWTKLRRVYGYPEPFMRAVLKHHRESGYLHLATMGGDPVALLLTLTHDSVATYYTAFSTELGYHHAAPTLLTWAALQTAKSQGCDIFDFGGIFDPRYPKMYKNWQGFTKFKEGFRPTVVDYPPTHLQLFW